MKTFNIYWLFSTCVLVWFLFIYSPYYFYTTHKIIDIPFGIHLLGAYSISIVCIINTLITPSMYGSNKNYHNLIGQYGMIMGVIEFIFGLYCCWYPYRKNLPPLSFSIAITAGGIGQLISQYYSYTSIKFYQSTKKQILQLQKEKQHHELLGQQQQQQQQQSVSNQSDKINIANQEIQLLEKQKQQYLIQHINYNIALFTIACGAPAFIRLVGKIVPENSPNSTMIVLLSILFLQILSIYYTRYFHKYIIIIQQPIINNDDVDGIVIVDPIQNNNNNNNNINTSTEVIASTTRLCIDTTTTTTANATANSNNASTPLLQQQPQNINTKNKY